MKHSEKKETPAYEAKEHGKPFLVAALRKKDPTAVASSNGQQACPPPAKSKK